MPGVLGYRRLMHFANNTITLGRNLCGVVQMKSVHVPVFCQTPILGSTMCHNRGHILNFHSVSMRCSKQHAAEFIPEEQRRIDVNRDPWLISIPGKEKIGYCDARMFVMISREYSYNDFRMLSKMGVYRFNHQARCRHQHLWPASSAFPERAVRFSLSSAWRMSPPPRTTATAELGERSTRSSIACPICCSAIARFQLLPVS